MTHGDDKTQASFADGSYGLIAAGAEVLAVAHDILENFPDLSPTCLAFPQYVILYLTYAFALTFHRIQIPHRTRTSQGIA